MEKITMLSRKNQQKSNHCMKESVAIKVDTLLNNRIYKTLAKNMTERSCSLTHRCIGNQKAQF